MRLKEKVKKALLAYEEATSEHHMAIMTIIYECRSGGDWEAAKKELDKKFKAMVQAEKEYRLAMREAVEAGVEIDFLKLTSS